MSRCIPNGARPSHLILTLAAALLIAAPAAAQVRAILPERFSIVRQGHTVAVPYDASHPLSERHEQVRHLVVMIHGLGRNAVHYHGFMQHLREQQADERLATLVPQFLVLEDIAAHQLDQRHAYWSRGGWAVGHRSRSDHPHVRPQRVSSFEFLDEMLKRAAVSYPNLDRITIAGHSAGGQFVNRYAAGNRLEPSLNDAGIEVRYIISNPSSYLYFCDHRATDRQSIRFAPISAEHCRVINTYRYGLENLNLYMQQTGVDRIQQQYVARCVTYLLGEEDNDPNSRYLDRGCGALAQGEHRLQRGLIYYEYLRFRFGPEVHERHRKVTVPGVGHSAAAMFTSERGRRVLFHGTD